MNFRGGGAHYKIIIQSRHVRVTNFKKWSLQNQNLEICKSSFLWPLRFLLTKQIIDVDFVEATSASRKNLFHELPYFY